VVATVKSSEPRINACSKSPSLVYFEPAEERIQYMQMVNKNMYTIFNACVVI
jgi:hypothetical protein